MSLRIIFLTFFCSGFQVSNAFLLPSTRNDDLIGISKRQFRPLEVSLRKAKKHFPLVQSIRIEKNSETRITQLQQVALSQGNAHPNEETTRTPLNPFFSATILILLDIGFRQLFQALNIAFPSSLGGCMALFASMLTIPKAGPKLFSLLSPGAALLAKWLPVFFVPSLVTLPLVGTIGSSTELLKILAVIVLGFYFTLLSTAGSVVGIRKLLNAQTEEGTSDNIDNNQLPGASVTSRPPPPPFSKSLVYQLRTVMVGTGVAAAITKTTQGPLSLVFWLSATLHNFCVGARLPKSFTKTVHPLVTCTTMTWTIATIFAKITGSTFFDMLRKYRIGNMNPLSSGAGDVLLFLLGPAVISLAISMYDRRLLMRDNLKEVVTGVTVSSVGGLVGTAALVRALNIGTPALRMSLLSRNITTPLAMAIATILGANVGLAVAMVVVTGLIGANFGASILSSLGIDDPIARGLGIGAAAHGLGTAALVDEKDAFPFAAISMALTATACTCLVSIPSIKKLILKIALGV